MRRGPKLASKGEFRFPNFITSDAAIRIIKHATPSGEFGQLDFVAFLFSLRVPSEALLLRRRAYANDDLEGFQPMRGRALISLRGPANNLCLVLRLATRKNLPLVCILRRHCFCDIAKCAERRLCPVHFLWPLVRARVPAGIPISPTYSIRNVNSVLRTALAKLSIPEASRFSPHGFRSGAAQELKTTGSQWPTVAAAGCWQSLSFKGYIDLTADVAREMSKLLAESFASDSDEDIPGTLGLFFRCEPLISEPPPAIGFLGLLSGFELIWRA